MLQSISFGIKSKKIIIWLTGAPAALAVGAAARLWLYFLNDSFWRDETKLLLNVAHKSFLQLLGPLDYGQEAPIPLLWLYRLFYLMGGGGELPLRAVSLLSSIFALYLFYCLAQRVIPERRAVLFVTWLMALAPGEILFAAMAKQYSLDLLAACALLYVAAPWFTKSEENPSSSKLAMAGGLTPWVSLPAVWIAGSIGLGMLGRGRRAGFKPALVFWGVLIFSFALEFFLILKRCLHLTKFIDYGIVPLTWDGYKLAFHNAFFAYHGPQYHFIFQVPDFLQLSLLAVGAWEVIRSYGWEWLVVLLLPLFLAFGANLAKVYPIFERTLLFAVPGLYLLLGYAAVLWLKSIPWPRLATLPLIFLLLPPIQTTVVSYMRPMGGVREALKLIAAQQHSQDLVYCDIFAAPTVAYYRLLKRPYALSLQYGWQPEKWIEGEVNVGKINITLLREESIWLVAETLQYARIWQPAPKFTGVLPYWQKLTEGLREVLPCLTVYINERVQLLRFSPQLALGEKSKLKPDLAKAHNNLGLALAGQGKLDQAVAHYAEALRLKPDLAAAHSNLGLALAAQGHLDQAVSHYAEALRLKPDFAEAHSNLGVALAAQGKMDQAVAHYAEALRLKPDLAETHNGLGLALAAQGQLDQAVAHYAEALRLKPDFAAALNNLGMALGKQGKIDEAITSFQKAIHIKPDFSGAYSNLGLALAKQGNIDQAIIIFQNALKINPNNIIAQKMLCILKAQRPHN